MLGGFSEKRSRFWISCFTRDAENVVEDFKLAGSLYHGSTHKFEKRSGHVKAHAMKSNKINLHVTLLDSCLNDCELMPHMV